MCREAAAAVAEAVFGKAADPSDDAVTDPLHERVHYLEERVERLMTIVDQQDAQLNEQLLLHRTLQQEHRALHVQVCWLQQQMQQARPPSVADRLDAHRKP